MGKDNKSEKTLLSELTINCFQAMNHFKLIGGNRRVAEKKYSTLETTPNAWEDLLKKDKLLK
jgi:hypothetical protein